jgi:uncharacterized protein (TIGR02996 family)
MSLHEAFLQSIIESADDDTPRLTYADWLEENDDPARAEFIRVQCRLAALDAEDAQRRAVQRREYELLADHWGEWAGPLIGRVRRWRFRRGFVEQVKMEAGQFLQEAKWLLDFGPIQELQVKYPEVEDLRALVASKHIRRITRLDLDHANLGDAGVSLLANSPNLGRLTALSLRFTHIGTDGLLALAKSPQLGSLRSLDVTANDLPRNALGAFAASCRLPLESLRWDRKISPDEIRALSGSPLAGRLKALHLREAHLGAKGLRLLAHSPAFTRLEELSVYRDEVGAAGVAALAGSPLFRRLASLDLPCAAVGDEDAVALAHSAQPPSLGRLGLSFNSIGPDGAKALADSPLCDSLTRLDLSGNPLGDRGVKAVLSSARLGNLRRLALFKCGVTRYGAKALLSWPQLGRLTYLRLEQNPIGRKAFDDLRARVGEHLHQEDFDDGLDGAEVIRRVKAEPPRCLRGLGARPDTELLRRFPRGARLPADFPCVAFELTHPDPQQKGVLLGYEDPRGSEGYDIFCSPYAIRWEPSGEQREFFDAEQHGRSGEDDGNCTIFGSGKRTAWRCGRRSCRDHAFIVTFLYRQEYPPGRYADRYLPFADQFYHIDLDAYCASQDRVVEIASFECK